MNETAQGFQKYYRDVEDIDGIFCDEQGCSECRGLDYNGEPNGYGCAGAEEWSDKVIGDGTYKEISSGIYYKADDVDARIKQDAETIRELRKQIEDLQRNIRYLLREEEPTE